MPKELTIEAQYEYCQETLKFKEQLEEGYLILAERLKKIRDEKLYASNWDYFESFLDEIKISTNAASKMIAIYEKFILGWKFKSEDLKSAGGWSNIAEIMTIVKNKEEATEALAMAGTLTRQDLRRYVKEKSTGISMAQCMHANSYLVKICKDCGDRIAQL